MKGGIPGIPADYDFTQKPSDNEGLMEQMIREKRETDKRRHPEKTDTKLVRKEVYSVLKLRKDMEAKGIDASNIKGEARKRYPNLAQKYPSLLNEALNHKDETIFKTVLNSILEKIELTQKKVISIERCTDAVETVLTQKFYKRTDS